jgi:hypothetical protein
MKDGPSIGPILAPTYSGVGVREAEFMDRRGFIRIGTSMVLALVTGPLGAGRRRAMAYVAGNSWTLRRVAPGDEDQLLHLMRSCVESAGSFHGLCRPVQWTRVWAEGVVSDRPRSIVAALNGTIVGYFDLPNKAPRTFGEETVDHYRRSFWCGAAGVRMDLLGPELAVQVFQQLLHSAFSDAIALGYEFVRAAAPWEQHPYLPRPFTAYPGLTSQPFQDDEGRTKFLLEWRLKDAVYAFAADGMAGFDG